MSRHRNRPLSYTPSAEVEAAALIERRAYRLARVAVYLATRAARPVQLAFSF